MTPLLLLLLLETQAPAAPAPVERTRVLVADFAHEPSDNAIANVVRDTLVTRIAKTRSDLNVITRQDIRNIADAEAEKQSVGCASDTSCLSEMADALGTRFIVTGTITKTTESYVISMSLFDQSALTFVSRESAEADGEKAVAPAVRAASDRLFGVGGSPLFIVGAAGLGVGAAVAVVGGLGCAVAEVTASNTKLELNERASAQDALPGWIGVTAAGVIVAGAGAVLIVTTGEE